MYRNKSLLEIARSFPCTHCGAIDGTVVAAHSNQLRDGDQGATLSKTERVGRWEEAHRKTIALLFESGFLYTKF